MLTIINIENDGLRLQTDNVPILSKLRDAGWTCSTSNVFYIPFDALIIPDVEDQNVTDSFYVTDNGGGTARLEYGFAATINLDDIEFADKEMIDGSV